MNERTEFRENRTKGNVWRHLTIVIRLMGGVTTALLRSRDGQSDDFFFNFFHQDLGEKKMRNTSDRFFIESKWKLLKKSKTKRCDSKPPINLSPNNVFFKHNISAKGM